MHGPVSGPAPLTARAAGQDDVDLKQRGQAPASPGGALFSERGTADAGGAGDYSWILRRATASISIRAPLGRAATWMQLRAGNGSWKNSA